MPFTPSHAVVALPFARTALPAAAVAAGAMTPDLPLFLRGLPLPYPATHDLRWLPLTIVLAACVLLVWRCVLRPVVPGLVPRWVAARLPREWERGMRASARETFAARGAASPSWRALLLLLAALAVGVVSHIVWDAFTHEGRLGVVLLPVLAGQWGPWPGYRWIQYGSGVVGLAVIGIWAVRWLRRAPVRVPAPVFVPSAVRIGWWLSLPVFLLAGAVVGVARFGPPAAGEWATDVAYLALTPAAALWVGATVVLCLVLLPWGLRSRRG